MTMQPPYRCSLNGHEFSEPAVLLEPEPSAVRALWSAHMFEFEQVCGPSYKREAAFEVLRGCIAYLEGADVETLCKKCAYMADVNGKVLCAVCRKHWHGTAYPSCYSCVQTSPNGGRVGTAT